MPSIRPLRLMVAALTTVVCGAFVLSAWRDHVMARHEAETELMEVARLMEEHTRAAFLAGELQISRIQEVLGQRRPAQAGSAADIAAMRRIAAEWPPQESAWIFDADANMHASTYDLPAAGTLNVHDRAYYTALRDGARGFVSPLIWAKLKPRALFALSRRLDNPDGSFAGGIVLSVDASYFTDFYKRLSPQPGAVFAIYKQDGSLVMRSSLPPGRETFVKPAPLLEHMQGPPAGLYDVVSEQDGVRRLYAYRRMEDYPVAVIAGLAEQEIYAGWRERTIRNGVIATVVLAAFLVLAHRLAATLRREATLRARAEALLADKEVLFQEVHHRVKNNLQIVSSFLTMQALRTPDPATAAAMEDALSRVQSMALVHQTLYQQNEAAEVSMDTYLRSLSASVEQTFGAARRGIAIDVDAADITLPMDSAVPLALVANEAMTNALKHAFPDGRTGTVRACLRRDGDHLLFTLSDDGIGMSEQPRAGLGTTILGALARQLRGQLEWRRDGGTRLSIRFPG